jgi:predicted kinase
VVLVGATAAGKSHWAHACFDAGQIVSSDRLRAAVGTGERDQRASRDAFEVLDLIVEKRLKRALTTVVDSTGLDARRRATWRQLAERVGVPVYAVVFETAAGVVRTQSRSRRSRADQGRDEPAARGRRRG